jgi:hypothetical protein
MSEALKLQVHSSEDVDTPRSVHARGSNMDAHRGVTPSLPQELGNPRFGALLCLSIFAERKFI